MNKYLVATHVPKIADGSDSLINQKVLVAESRKEAMSQYKEIEKVGVYNPICLAESINGKIGVLVTDTPVGWVLELGTLQLMTTKDNWKEFRDKGLLLYINQMLHVFGYAITMTFDDKKEITDVSPIKCDYSGFAEDDTAIAYRRIRYHMMTTFNPKDGNPRVDVPKGKINPFKVEKITDPKLIKKLDAERIVDESEQNYIDQEKKISEDDNAENNE